MAWKGFKDIRATILVDVTSSEEEILDRVDRSRRKNIKKAVDAGLKFEEAKNEEDWNAWYEIYKKVWTEGGIEYENLDFFKKPSWRLFLVKLNEKIIGGGCIEELEKKIVFKAFASLIEFQELRVNDFLYWNFILYGKKNEKEQVDLGGWQINARGHLVGINAFKEKWGGQVVYYDVYSKNPFYILGRKAIRNSAFFRWIWDRIKGRPIIRPEKHKLNQDYYDTPESVKHFDNLNSRGLFEVEKNIAEKYFKGKILDLGCGCGRTTIELFNKKFDVIGLDISKNMINFAKNKYPAISFEVGDACDLKFPDESFDIVFFSYNGIDYIFPESKRIVALKEINRVLKNGGYFVFSSHNPGAIFTKFRPKFILRNLFRGSLFSRYKYEKQNFGGFYTYYGRPKKQKKLVEENTNMKLVEVVVDKKDRLHPYYVFRK